MQAYDGTLNFATDAWTSPNGRAFIAVTVHLETDGTPESLLLDIVECARSHTGTNLAATFEKVVDDFGIGDKVRSQKKKGHTSDTSTRYWGSLATTRPVTTR